MRILMLSWEYPPQSVGGLARHVEDLAISLAHLRHDVHVLTIGRPGQVSESRENGVIVHRVEAYPVHAPDFLTWVLQLNARFLEEAMIVMRKYGPFQIIHAHDWLVAFTGRALKHAHRLPLIATIHATEAGRNRGLYNDMQRYINSVEWWLTYEAWRVIVCSQHMRQEVQGLFQLPADKITIIPNGVYSQKFRAVAVDPMVQQRYAAPHEKIIFFVGRLVIEKGVQVLLEAMPRILTACPEAKLVVAGQGPMEGQLQNRARELGISHKVYFAGYIDDQTRNQLYRAARVAVFPSLYEPFGIVALEAMAAGTPVVASETGGLTEIITHGVDGMRALPGNAGSLADNILAVLRDDTLAQALRANGRRLVTEVYDWENIARRTVDVYQEVYSQYRRTSWPERPSVVARLWRFTPSTAGDQLQEQPLPLGGRYDLPQRRAALVNQRRGRGEG
ncbi:Glycosyl transferase, family 1 [Moorella glycerini]|uniref:Glycogen synthase n=1 Tax=Neomoorella stamsii TaxID=1266720 RepID=A0A9X7P6Y2_9FIRM|nr:MULTISPECIES: glycosyltransferase family 4 protein [Moorella]PRR74430.1 Glycogen synthase [Moorella stamsii]CEP67923.1 Glycosyl transferase, family 1 [Moorella glycerini]